MRIEVAKNKKRIIFFYNKQNIELHPLGGNKNARDKYKGHKYFQDTVDFCEKWDQKSFDPNYKSLKLKDFEPYIRKVFSRTPYKQ
tara:strand:- start:840 stop:1094 length:255 start_codon:yes stop_codon:yes gene_type:complete